MNQILDFFLIHNEKYFFANYSSIMVIRKRLEISVLLLTALKSHFLKNGATDPTLPAISLKRFNKSLSSKLNISPKKIIANLKALRNAVMSAESGNSLTKSHTNSISSSSTQSGVAER